MIARQTITPALKALAELYMDWDGYGSAGYLHIWFADPNYEREHVAYCAGSTFDPTHWAREAYSEDYRKLAYYLARIGALYLTRTQRERLATLGWKYD